MPGAPGAFQREQYSMMKDVSTTLASIPKSEMRKKTAHYAVYNSYFCMKAVASKTFLSKLCSVSASGCFMLQASLLGREDTHLLRWV